MHNNNPFSKGEKKFAILIFSLAITAILTVLGTYFANFNGKFGDQNTFGTFGDFLGGTLNPLLSFFTILLLIWSIQIQVKELRETKNEFKRSAEAQEEIDKNQKAELTYYKEKGSIESILAEFNRLDAFKNEILDTPLSGNNQIRSILMHGNRDLERYLQTIIKNTDYNYTAKEHSDACSPIVHITTAFIEYSSDFDYYLDKLYKKEQYELYILKAYSFSALLEKLAFTKLGMKIQLNGLANNLHTRNTQLPDLNDKRLNGLKTFIEERVIKINELTELIDW